MHGFKFDGTVEALLCALTCSISLKRKGTTYRVFRWEIWFLFPSMISKKLMMGTDTWENMNSRSFNFSFLWLWKLIILLLSLILMLAMFGLYLLLGLTFLVLWIQVDDVNSMFANIDELRKNGWTQIQPPADEVNFDQLLTHHINCSCEELVKASSHFQCPWCHCCLFIILWSRMKWSIHALFH